MKLLEDNIGENLDDLGYGDTFLDTTPKAQPMRKNDELNFTKIKNFYPGKHNVKRMTRQVSH